MKQNVRAKILLLTILTIGPTIALLVYFNIQQLRRSQEIELTHLQSVAQIIATEHAQINEGARQLLISLSTSLQTKNPTECDNYLSNLIKKYKRYANFGVANSQGELVCSAIKSPETINISGRYSFKQILATHDFTIGEYTVSQITNRSILNYGYPLGSGIVYASLDLSWLNDLVSNLKLEEELIVLILDKNGVVLAQNPVSAEWIGKKFFLHFSPQSENTVEFSEADGVDRLFSYQKIGDALEGPFVAVGIPKSTIFQSANKQFSINLILTFFIAIFSVFIGLAIGSSLISNIINTIKGVDELKRDFVSLVSHQIRTPLTAIKWFTQILQSGSAGKLTKKQTELLKDTSESVNRMTNLVTTLLTISKLESGKIPINYKKISLVNLITDCNSEVRNAFSEKGINFKQHSPAQVTVEVDPNLFKQAIINLIHNAYKYSKNHGRVMVIVKRQKDNILIEVRDFGIGIPKSDSDKLWKKFSRGTNAHKSDTEGAGLGLYLTKLIIEAHQGKIWFASSSKSGTSFFFTIPIKVAKL